MRRYLGQSRSACDFSSRIAGPSCSSSLNHVCDFSDQRAILKIPAERVPVLVIDEEEITEWAVDDVKTDVGAPLPCIAVVLNESIQKHRGRKRIVQPRTDEVCPVMSIAETDAAVREIQSIVEFVAQAECLVERIRTLVSCVKRAIANAKRQPIAPRRIGFEIYEVVRRAIDSGRNHVFPVIEFERLS